jgi:hypothetical protein
MSRKPLPLKLSLEAGAGKYQVTFSDWHGQPFDRKEYASLHRALDDAMAVVSLKAARRQDRAR